MRQPREARPFVEWEIKIGKMKILAEGTSSDCRSCDMAAACAFEPVASRGLNSLNGFKPSKKG